ncbi:hypothetical protein JY97_00435 [Alkalispirochaeta odontotermitis]|nr:hypothetical protein JY97_00435 [Alkalispirochaeta odontotermitis]
MSEPTELKPCPIPWCVGEAELCFPEPIGDNRGSVMCMSCYFAGPEHSHWRDAVTQWNHRPTETALIEALKRIASAEALTLPFYNKMQTPAEKELDARIDFARNALKQAGVI